MNLLRELSDNVIRTAGATALVTTVLIVGLSFTAVSGPLARSVEIALAPQPPQPERIGGLDLCADCEPPTAGQQAMGSALGLILLAGPLMALVGAPLRLIPQRMRGTRTATVLRIMVAVQATSLGILALLAAAVAPSIPADAPPLDVARVLLILGAMAALNVWGLRSALVLLGDYQVSTTWTSLGQPTSQSDSGS